MHSDNINTAFSAYKAQPGEELQAELIRHMRKFAYALIWSKLRQNRPDLVNFAVWKAIRQLDSFRGESQFGTWFRRIVENLCNTTLRQEKSRNEVELNEEVLDEVQPNDVPYQEFISFVEDHQDRELLRKVVEGYTSREIAKLLGMTPANVRTRLRRLRGRLKEAVV